MLTKNDLKQIHGIVKEVVQKENLPIKKDIKRIRKDINVVISAFDNSYVDLRKRVERVEEHLNLPTTN